MNENEQERTLKTCNRCGYRWLSKKEPKFCARCNSPYYNKERVRPTENSVVKS